MREVAFSAELYALVETVLVYTHFLFIEIEKIFLTRFGLPSSILNFSELFITFEYFKMYILIFDYKKLGLLMPKNILKWEK